MRKKCKLLPSSGKYQSACSMWKKTVVSIMYILIKHWKVGVKLLDKVTVFCSGNFLSGTV